MSIRLVALCLYCLLPVALSAAGVSSFTKSVQANGKTFAVKGVRVNLRDPQVRVRVGLAWDHVGRTESLGAMAKRLGAVAAINGSFFDAYSGAALRNPDMSLIKEGQLLFKSDLGTMLGFTADNTPQMLRLRYRLVGTVETTPGRPQRWFAYWMNRRPTANPCVTVFTRHWGPRVELDGMKVVVEGDTVTAITAETAAIPADGYVIHLLGEGGLQSRFREGATVTFNPEIISDDAAGLEAWTSVREAVGAGPRVLRNGTPVFSPGAEGFNDPKILQLAGARSAAGFTADAVLYLITVGGARVADLGHILKALGCVEGMNLDGGASSGLWYRGNYLTTPGRNISNALLIVEQAP